MMTTLTEVEFKCKAVGILQGSHLSCCCSFYCCS